MAVPKKKTSPMKRDMRRAHHALKKVNPFACPSCGEAALPHKVCPHCNNYKGKPVTLERD